MDMVRRWNGFATTRRRSAVIRAGSPSSARRRRPLRVRRRPAEAPGGSGAPRGARSPHGSGAIRRTALRMSARMTVSEPSSLCGPRQRLWKTRAGRRAGLRRRDSASPTPLLDGASAAHTVHRRHCISDEEVRTRSALDMVPASEA